MRSKPAKFHRVGAIALATTALLAACSSSDDDASTDTASPPTAATPATDPPATDPPPTDPPTTESPTTSPATTAAPEPSTTTEPEPVELSFEVAGIEEAQQVPLENTCDGENLAPVVTVDSVPAETMQLVFILDDPDAPTPDPFAHWVVYGIPADSQTITDMDPAYVYGMNDIGAPEWFGPCPPPGDGPHNYQFRLIALSESVDLAPGLDARQVEEAIEAVTLSESQIVAFYEA